MKSAAQRALERADAIAVQPANPAAPATTEIIEPLSDVEAGLCAAVDRWREQRKEELERAWQSVLTESNARIAPVLRAHGVGPGATWELRPDEAAKSGWALVKKGAPDPDAETVKPIDARREVRKVKKLTERQLHAPRRVR